MTCSWGLTIKDENDARNYAEYFRLDVEGIEKSLSLYQLDFYENGTLEDRLRIQRVAPDVYAELRAILDGARTRIAHELRGAH